MQILTARRLQHAGHVPFALVGGATGMIGDPKESGERTLNSLDVVKDWVERVRGQIEPFLSFEGDNAATMVNNYDWTASLSAIDFLRDIGKHFPVNRMLARDVVQPPARGRHQLHRVQLRAAAVDGLPQPAPRLRRHAAVRRQRPVGQHHRRRRADPARRRRPRCTPSPPRWSRKTDGTKYGKTEGGALWLDPEMLSPYAFHQFWLNVEDEKVGELLRIFTFLAARGDRGPRGSRRRRSRSCAPGRRRWPTQVTTLVHGAEETERAKAAAAALFGGGDLTDARPGPRSPPLCARPGSTQVPPRRRAARASSTCSSTPGCPRARARPAAPCRRGRRLRQQRAGRATPSCGPAEDDLLGGSWLVLRRGKKHLAGVEVV